MTIKLKSLVFVATISFQVGIDHVKNIGEIFNCFLANSPGSLLGRKVSTEPRYAQSCINSQEIICNFLPILLLNLTLLKWPDSGTTCSISLMSSAV